MSFSEGQSPIIPVIHKSGYNEETSSKYNVVTSCTPSGEGEEKSISDQIKVCSPDLINFLLVEGILSGLYNHSSHLLSFLFVSSVEFP